MSAFRMREQTMSARIEPITEIEILINTFSDKEGNYSNFESRIFNLESFLQHPLLQFFGPVLTGVRYFGDRQVITATGLCSELLDIHPMRLGIWPA